MLDQERIRRMTGLAIFEKSGGAEELRITEHFRYDYCMTQLFSAFIRFCLAYLTVLGIYLLFNSNDFFYRINNEGFLNTVKTYGLYFLIGLAAYMAIALLVYLIRYRNAMKSTRLYAKYLKQLLRIQSGRKSGRV